jgi:hypothetical protein
MGATATYRFDPVDLEQMRLLGRLSPGQRIQVMLDARELAVGLIRGRLRRQYPDLPLREINLKVLEEIARAKMSRRSVVSSPRSAGFKGPKQESKER